MLIWLAPVLTSFLYFYRSGEISFWPDEITTLEIISYNQLAANIKNYYTTQLSPPLYFILLKLFTWIVPFIATAAYFIYFIIQFIFSIIGLNLIFELNLPLILNKAMSYLVYAKLDQLSEFSLRFFSGLCMVGVNFLVFNFIRRKNLFLAIMICIFIATNERMINMAQDSKPYALFTFLFLGYIFEFIKLQTQSELSTFKNNKKLYIWGLLLILSHAYSIFVIISTLIFLIIKNSGSFKKNKLNYFLLITSIVSAIFLTPLLKNDQMFFIKKFDIYNTLSSIQASYSLFFPLEFYLYFFSLMLISQLTYLKKIFLNTEIKILSRFLLILYATVFTLTSLIPVFSPRYIEFLTPAFLIAMVYFSYVTARFVFYKLKIISLILFMTIIFPILLYQINMTKNKNLNFTRDYKNLYPIDRAMQTIGNDRYHFKKYYFIEDLIFNPLNYYDNKHKVYQLDKILPQISNDHKIQLVEKHIYQKKLDVFYYIKVKNYDATKALEPSIQINNYSKTILFSLDRIVVFKFTKQSKLDLINK